MVLLSDWVRSTVRPYGIIAVAGSGLLCGACAGTSELALGGPNAQIASAANAEKTAPTDGLDDLEKAIIYWGKKSAESPADEKAVLSYVRNLKAAGRKRQALAVLQQASIYHGSSRAFAGEYGRLALSLDQTSLAERLLKAADNPTEPDWQISSALGTAVAKQGKYADAIPHFQRSLQLKPGEPNVQNNLAMAYAANGQPAEAEKLLREAVRSSKPGDKVQKNLALVLSLQGKDAEAKQFASGTMDLRGSMPADKVVAGSWKTKFAEVK